METKGLEQTDRGKLISLCSTSDGAGLALEVLKGYKHLTIEQRKEIVCVGRLKFALNKYPELLDIFIDGPALHSLCVDWRITARTVSHTEALFEKADLLADIKHLGYTGRRVLIKSHKKYCQFFCGKSKPSFEIELKPAK